MVCGRWYKLKVLLLAPDSVIPNLAIMKLSAYHKNRGDEVGFNVTDPDKIYLSIVFDRSAHQSFAVEYPNVHVEVGGSGVDLKKELPNEIEMLKPDYDLYPSTYSQGFTTRGCVRKCPFCVVPIKEGMIKTNQHPSEFHDDRFKTCMIMDNNLLAAPLSWQKGVFDWFHDNDIRMLEHGMDIRLLTEQKAGWIADTKLPKGVRFAWDNMDDEPYVEKGVRMLLDAGMNGRNIGFYVLTNFNTTIEQDVCRCMKLRDWGVNSYVMIYNKRKAPKIVRKLQRWANMRACYWKVPFQEYNQLDFIQRKGIEVV